MAEFTGELFTHLKAQSAVTSILGSGTACRLFPDAPRQNAAMPYAFVEQVSGEASETLSTSLRGSGIEAELIDVYAVAETKGAAYDLQEAMRLNLHSYRGYMGSTFVCDCAITGGIEQGVDRPQDNSDRHRYWCKRTYQFTHLLPTS